MKFGATYNTMCHPKEQVNKCATFIPPYALQLQLNGRKNILVEKHEDIYELDPSNFNSHTAHTHNLDGFNSDVPHWEPGAAAGS
jgi:hypothetical protein